MTPIRWAVVGTGSIAQNFAADLAYCENAVLGAVVSRDRSRAKAFATRFGGAGTSGGIPELAASGRVDAVYLATPNHLHADDALTALEAGLPVLVEKPLATRVGDAETLATTAARNGRFLMEGLWTRFLPAVAEAKRLLAENAIGPVRAVEATLAYAKPRAPESAFFQPEGGGALLDLGVYPISLALRLFGWPDGVSGQWTEGPNGVDLSADLTLDYPGFAARLACGFDRDGDNLFVVHGEKASLVIEAPFLAARRLTILQRNIAADWLAHPAASASAGRVSRLIRRIGGKTLRFDYPGYGLHHEIEAASRAIAQGRTEHATAPLADSIATLEIIRDIRAAAPQNPDRGT